MKEENEVTEGTEGGNRRKDMQEGRKEESKEERR
jgi:hypothetical protein